MTRSIELRRPRLQVGYRMPTKEYQVHCVVQTNKKRFGSFRIILLGLF